MNFSENPILGSDGSGISESEFAISPLAGRFMSSGVGGDTFGLVRASTASEAE